MCSTIEKNNSVDFVFDKWVIEYLWKWLLFAEKSKCDLQNKYIQSTLSTECLKFGQ